LSTSRVKNFNRLAFGELGGKVFLATPSVAVFSPILVGELASAASPLSAPVLIVISPSSGGEVPWIDA